jgi:hypothetical protein
MARGKYELVFAGSASVRAYSLPRYRRYHRTVESARETAATTLARLEEKVPGVAAAHPAIVYGPGCGRDGVKV